MRDVGLSYESLKRHALLGFPEARNSVLTQIRRIDATQDLVEPCPDATLTGES